ncbi:MAG: PLP-dependent aspartate aminotransferase family protein [Bacteroidales bacterium]
MKKKTVNSSRMPLYRDAGFELYDAETTKDAFAKETGNERVPGLYIYSRYRNPTVASAEAEVMKLEESVWALLTQSGMSAIDTAVSVFQHTGNTRPWLFFSEIYGGTISYTESILKNRRGVQVSYFNPVNEVYNLEAFACVLRELRPGLVYIEAISNPMLIVTDLQKVIEMAHSEGAAVIVDNTFATPVLCKPLALGADMVIHSATKYFSGHGNITAGVLCGNDTSLMKQAIEYRKYVGHMISPDDAYRLQTQIQTFGLRFAAQSCNATGITELLVHHPAVEKVWYPGLPGHPSHQTALRLFGDRGFGAMVTFGFRGPSDNEKKDRRDKFIKAVSDSIKIIPSLGDPRTIIMPVESVWGAKYPDPGIIRMSPGFEDWNNLERIISGALDEVK